MRHAVLYGEYEISFDSKHRALLPVELRRAIDPKRDGEALFLVVGIIAAVLGFTSIAGASLAIAKFLAGLFLVLFVLFLILAIAGVRKVF